MKQQLIEWLKSQQHVLDEIIYEAALDYFKTHNQQPNFGFDLSECQSESFNLISGKDLCYDRPNTAFCYSLWYHARRVNTFLSFFSDALLNTYQDQIEIFDLGAGTGAVQWALGLIVVGMKELNIPTPKLTIVNVDSSPFMLYYGKDYLWKHFIKKYPLCNSDRFIIKHSVNSWSNPENITLTNTWVSSSYLFDMSDNKEEITKSFFEIVDTLKPTNLLLLTSVKKNDFLTEVATDLSKHGYEKRFISQSTGLLYKGGLEKVNQLRRTVGQQYPAKAMSNAATWDDLSFVGVGLHKQQTMLSLNTGLKLFTVSEKDRTKIKLSADQLRASKPTGKPAIIVGPAGCGKSVVLTERVRNIVEAHDYAPSLKILLTTFNKDLVRYLGDWLEQLLDSKKCRREFGTDFNGTKQQYSYFRFNGSNSYNIFILHFDVLPTRVGKINYKKLTEGQVFDIEQFHLDLIAKISEDLKPDFNLSRKDLELISSPDFLFDEYHRVIYGQQCTSPSSYFSIERVGRGVPVLRTNSLKRKFIWDVIIKYVKYLKNNNLDSFTLRRYKFLQKLKKANNAITRFNYVFVDELQDCTDADYEIFYQLVTDPNNIVLAGDLAQSIRIGATARVPRANDERMKKFERVVLEGSYRLPFRVSEAIVKFSEKINSKRLRAGNDQTGNVISPFKGSPPGARPIIVYGSTWGEMITKIKCIALAYKPFGFDTISIFEKDQELYQRLAVQGLKVTQETILKAKGLEKQCVLWSTRVMVDTEKEVDEFVYTILTRTSCLLIIALCGNVAAPYAEILKTFNRERIIFWDQASKTRYDEICNSEFTEDEEIEDTSEDYTGGETDEELVIES